RGLLNVRAGHRVAHVRRLDDQDRALDLASARGEALDRDLLRAGRNDPLLDARVMKSDLGAAQLRNDCGERGPYHRDFPVQRSTSQADPMVKTRPHRFYITLLCDGLEAPAVAP